MVKRVTPIEGVAALQVAVAAVRAAAAVLLVNKFPRRGAKTMKVDGRKATSRHEAKLRNRVQRENWTLACGKRESASTSATKRTRIRARG